MSRIFHSFINKTSLSVCQQANHSPKMRFSFVLTPSKEPYGLRATLDRLVYFRDPDKSGSDQQHAFIYFITIANLSNTTITLNGRRWVIRCEDGHQNVIEGQGIVGKEPTLAPGESFAYNSHHVIQANCSATGAFHGIDSSGDPIHVRIPSFDMMIPPESSDGQTELDL
jgi:ApaG protein